MTPEDRRRRWLGQSFGAPGSLYSLPANPPTLAVLGPFSKWCQRGSARFWEVLLPQPAWDCCSLEEGPGASWAQ